ncbi:molybdopterin synthase sulfur carrier subunit [Caulobacter ginsengisoli]|uniref:Molybdopterin synthase sulfur carrier subunit n=1 Tax=Caulobacter ginsengisoli TaxID=400775 RepID=A0ABU0ISR7_9CAUL|nr:molybdopterin synthase sulfur carrier subunit [Caulobacter ginsengisoli]MDQ0464416.1 molybdopterin synthase sulfur carrier subunit [Caulobacter ginsengisoli]
MIDAQIRPEAPSGGASPMVRVLFFGPIGDCCGRSLEVALPSAGCPLSQFKLRIVRQVEGATQALGQRGMRVAIDQAMITGDPWVFPGQEVTFLSPFSGG